MSPNRRLAIEVDFRSKVPITLQIVEAIKARVSAGRLRPNDQLPTVRQMAADLGVNFNTVARGYRLLDDAGLISTQQGRGTYVLESAAPERSRRLRQATLDGLVRSFLATAARLGYSPEDVERRLGTLMARWAKRGAVTEGGEVARKQVASSK
jgi:GntR family transcriptional regulator